MHKFQLLHEQCSASYRASGDVLSLNLLNQMTTPKFTPGPWEVRLQGPSIRRIATTAVPNRHIADVVPVLYDYDKASYTMEANATLIASAPALYAALEELEGYFHRNPNVTASGSQRARIRAALALARGEKGGEVK